MCCVHATPATHDGAWFTVMVKLFVLEFPQQSVATAVTVLVPAQKKLPDGGYATTVTLLQDGLLAPTVNQTCVHGQELVTTMLLGQLSVGAVVF